MKFKPRNPICFVKEVHCLGLIVLEYGYKMDPTKIQAVLSLKNNRPKTVGEVRHLLVLLSYYYRRYIQDFSGVAKPLFHLIQRNEPVTNKSKTSQASSSQTMSWTDEHSAILNQLLQSLTSLELRRAFHFTQSWVQFWTKNKSMKRA